MNSSITVLEIFVLSLKSWREMNSPLPRASTMACAALPAKVIAGGKIQASGKSIKKMSKKVLTNCGGGVYFG